MKVRRTTNCKFCHEEINPSQRNCGGYHWQCKDFLCMNASPKVQEMYITIYGTYEPTLDKAELYDENGFKKEGEKND